MQKSEEKSKIEFQLKVGLAIKEQREKLGLSQFKLSIESGLPKTQIGRIERGEVNTTIFSLKKIINTFGITFSDFFASLED